MGGFSKSKNIEHFVRFAKKVAEEFGKDVKYILTINEPNVYSSFGYMTGEWPPQQKNIVKFIWIFYNLSKAHNRAYVAMKEVAPHLLIGPATQFGNSLPKRPDHWLDKRVSKAADYFWNCGLIESLNIVTL